MRNLGVDRQANILLALMLLCLGLVLVIGGCANPPPIYANPSQSVESALTSGPLGGTIHQGLLDAQYNFNTAKADGILAANDPAPDCLNALLGPPGAPPGPSFVPRISDLISAGSVAYIYARQAEGVAAGPTLSIPLPCKAVIGQVVIDGYTAARSAAGVTGIGGIGASLLPAVQ